jgi:hypothetical protein
MRNLFLLESGRLDRRHLRKVSPRRLLLPTENPRANLLAPPQRKMKRAGLC